MRQKDTDRSIEQEARQLVSSMFAAIDEQAWDRLADSLDDAVIYERPGYAPMVGLPSVLHFYREVRILAAGTHQIRGIAVDKDVGASWGRFRGVTREGRQAEVEYSECYRFSRGRIVSRKSYFFVPLV
jgi:uncharacterized protein